MADEDGIVAAVWNETISLGAAYGLTAGEVVLAGGLVCGDFCVMFDPHRRAAAEAVFAKLGDREDAFSKELYALTIGAGCLLENRSL